MAVEFELDRFVLGSKRGLGKQEIIRNEIVGWTDRWVSSLGLGPH